MFSRPAPNLPPNKLPVVISGPSGVGKGTLIKLLFERHPDTFAFSVSHTTRSPRNGEQNGVDYHFVTKEAFQALKEQNGFVESAQFGSNFYGTGKATIQEQSAKGKVVVLDIEMEGVKQIKASDLKARYVFIAPPSEEELERRLRGRGTDKEEDIIKRLTQAKKELEYSKTPGVHDKIIVNEVGPVATCSVFRSWFVLMRCRRTWKLHTRSWRSLSTRLSRSKGDLYKQSFSPAYIP